jgi:Holliday junction resolvasome RuvABC endonuclease subunit
VAALLGLASPPESDHAADALALAICHASQTRKGIRGPVQNGNA